MRKIKGKSKRIYELERIRNARTVQLYADGFNSLSKREKIFAYYLSRAAIAGRTIAIDQTNKYATAIMTLCEKILGHPEGIPSRTMRAIREYTKLFWINNGMYEYGTNKKFIPSCSPDEFENAVRIASARDRGAVAGVDDFIVKFSLIKTPMFDPDYMPVVTDKSPGHDFIAQSANNFYDNLTTNEVDAWSSAGKEKYPLNSRAVKLDGKIQEEVWRAGGNGTPAGMYSRELANIITYLEKAKAYASGSRQANAVGLLVDFFGTGDPADWEKFNIDWVKYTSNVDFILGFIEVYMDPRGRKGKYESVVYFTDKQQTRLMRKLAANAQYFEDRAPWADEYRKKEIVAPIANVVNVIVETGDAGPVSAIGINLPNEQHIRQTYGSKSVLLHNIVAAYNASEPKGLLEEFCYDRFEVRRAKKFGPVADDLHTAMHEVLGHASGKVSDRLNGDPANHLPGYYSTLEEARADLVALWNVFDPKLKRLKMVRTDDVGKTMYDSYVRNVFLQLRRIPVGDQLEEDHMKNRQMVVSYIMNNSNVIEVEKKRGKTFFHIIDYEKMHDAVGELLSEVMRIKAEGDLRSAKRLIDMYGLKINTEWRDEVMKRVKKLGLSSYTGFVMPELKPVFDRRGMIRDVRIAYPLDLTKQMLDFSRMGQ